MTTAVLILAAIGAVTLLLLVAFGVWCVMVVTSTWGDEG